MPSPLNGFTAPAASPTSSMPGTACGERLKLIGSGPDSSRPSAVSSEMPNDGRQHRRERVEQSLRRDVLEVLERVQQPGAQVDRASRHREQPPVARQEQVALPEVEPRFEPWPGVIVRAVVAARGDPERPALVAHDAGRLGEPRRRAVGRDDEPGAHLDRLRVLVLGRAGSCAPRTHPSLMIGRDGLGALHQSGAGLLRALRQQRVEVVPRPHQAVVGERPQLRERQLDRGVAGVDAQTLHPLESRLGQGRRPS